MQFRYLIKYLQLFILVYTSFTLVSCSSSPRFTKDDAAETDFKVVEGKESVLYKDYAPVKTFEGVASFYAYKYHGRKTANGEIYNMYGLSAAHPTFPFGTIIRVVNLKNHKSCIVKVNDRMPYNHKRIIDLSLGAAKKLDMINDGIVKVRLEILKWGNKK